MNEKKETIKWVLNHPVWIYPRKRDREGEGEIVKELLSDDLDYLPDFGWENCITIIPMFVNPETKRVDEDESKNTHFEVWLEAGPPMMPDEHFDNVLVSHDINLDCGGDTLDEALISLAALVKEHYGDYKKEEHWTTWHQTSPHGILNKIVELDLKSHEATPLFTKEELEAIEEEVESRVFNYLVEEDQDPYFDTDYTIFLREDIRLEVIREFKEKKEGN